MLPDALVGTLDGRLEASLAQPADRAVGRARSVDQRRDLDDLIRAISAPHMDRRYPPAIVRRREARDRAHARLDVRQGEHELAQQTLERLARRVDLASRPRARVGQHREAAGLERDGRWRRDRARLRVELGLEGREERLQRGPEERKEDRDVRAATLAPTHGAAGRVGARASAVVRPGSILRCRTRSRARSLRGSACACRPRRTV